MGTIGLRRKALLVALLALVDLAIALAGGLLYVAAFGVGLQFHTYPGICANSFGRHVNCALEEPVNIASLVLVAVLFVGLVASQVRWAGRHDAGTFDP